jgi:hypothetical protein
MASSNDSGNFFNHDLLMLASGEADMRPIPTVEEMIGMSLRLKVFAEEKLPGMKLAFTNEEDPRCGGGKPLADCATAQSMIAEAEKQAVSDQAQHPEATGPLWTTYAWLGKTCADCTRSCEVAVLMDGPEYTGVARFTATEDDPTIPVFDLTTGELKYRD